MTITHLPPAGAKNGGYGNVQTRTLDQRLAALRIANDVRGKRADFKTALKGGADPAPLVEAPPVWALTWKANAFLLAIPKIGRTKANAILRTCAISNTKTLGGLSGRQRAVLAQVVGPLRAPAGLQAPADPVRRPNGLAGGRSAPIASETV